MTYLSAAGKLSDPRPLSCAIAAISVGVVDGRVRVDLPYEEDSRAEVDMNVVATDTGTLVEVQGTGEGATFPRSTLDKLLDAAQGACEKLFVAQNEALALPIRVCCPRAAHRRKRSEADPLAGRQPKPQEAGRVAAGVGRSLALRADAGVTRRRASVRRSAGNRCDV